MKARQTVAACVFLLCLTGCGCTDQPKQAASPPPAAQATLSLSATTEALPAEATGGFDGSKAFAHVEKLVAVGPRTPGSAGIRRAQEYIRGQLDGAGCKVEEDNFEAVTPAGKLPMKNIVAKISGSSSSLVLLMTHYDTRRMEGFVGANDGGSSTGLMLEMARQLCPRKHAFEIWIVFFDGEEDLVRWSDIDGTFGSRQMAAKLALTGELKRIKAAILADMIGDRDLNIRRETNSTAWLTDLVWSAAARLGYTKYFLSDSQAVEDDHTAFLRRGVPATDLIDFDYPAWHTPADTLDKISPRSLGIVGHVLLESLKDLEKKFR